MYETALILSTVLSHAQEVIPAASGANGAVVAGEGDSAKAGLEILKAGGNAADAAAATLLALNVTDFYAFCSGGEVPVIVYDEKRDVVEVIAGLGAAPRLATLEWFQERGGIEGGTPQCAPVPAALDAIITLLDRFGTMRFADVVGPALRILEMGTEEWHPKLARTWRRLIEAEQAVDDRQRGLRRVVDCFYRGPIAREIDAWSRASGGLLRYSDLATHASRIEEPLRLEYHGHTIYKCGPWTQGAYLLQTLRLLEGFDLDHSGFHTAETIHLVVEAMKLALADRDEYYGDPLFEEVPLDALLSDAYTALRRALIDPKQASKERRVGDPREMKALLHPEYVRTGKEVEKHDTTNCITADRFGNVVVATPSGWGGVYAGDTGILLSSRLISFNLWPQHPNCIEPGKRPRITLTPSLVMKDGKPVLAVSVVGGDSQDQAGLQIITNYIHNTHEVRELVTTPSYDTLHLIGSFNQTPAKLGHIMMSPTTPKDIVRGLEQRGHIVESAEVAQCRTALVIDQASGMYHAAGDPGSQAPRHVEAY